MKERLKTIENLEIDFFILRALSVWNITYYVLVVMIRVRPQKEQSNDPCYTIILYENFPHLS